MSDSEDETDFSDFSASEDEYVPPAEDDSDSDEIDDDEDDDSEAENSSTKRPKEWNRTNNSIASTSKSAELYKIANDGDDSDSSVENYLVNPNEINLESDFFNSNPSTACNVPAFDCNIGVSLSDSDGEVFEKVSSTSHNAVSKQLDFVAHENFNKELERAKNQLKSFQSSNFGQDASENDVAKLLAIGEASSTTLSSSKKIRKNQSNATENDESEWEKVEEEVVTQSKDNVQIEIRPFLKNKSNKQQAKIDMEAMEASIQRKLNRRKKEKQLALHKDHLLAWIRHGNDINNVLNSPTLMQMVAESIPYPKEQTDLPFFDEITKAYKTVVDLQCEEQDRNLKLLPPDASSLANQIKTKSATSKRDFVFIFIILLRSMGVQCRLVINLATVPLRPPAEELFVVSKRNINEKTTHPKKLSESLKTKRGLKKDKPSSKPKITKVARHSSNLNDKLISSQSKDFATLSTTMTNQNVGTSKNTKDFGKRSLSLSINPVVDAQLDSQPKRTKIGSVTDGQINVQRFTRVNSNAASSSSPISKRTRKKVSWLDSEPITQIPQLDGTDDTSRKRNRKLLKSKDSARSAPLLKFKIPRSSSRTVSTLPSKSKLSRSLKSKPMKPKVVKPISDSSTMKAESKVSSSRIEIVSKSVSRATKTQKVQSTSVSSSTTKAGSKRALTNTTTSPVSVAQKLRSKIKSSSSKLNKTTSLTSSAVKEISNIAKKRKSIGNASPMLGNPMPKTVEKLKKRIDRRILSTDDETIEPEVRKNDMNYWVEVFYEGDNKWMCIDLFELKVNSIDNLKKNATKPIAYVFAWNNDNTIKDVSPRYCSQWNTTTRKLRVEPDWLIKTLDCYQEANTPRSQAEDEEFNKIAIEEALPKTISEYKNHPLYVLKRHLLKFEGIYPPDAVSCGFIRGEAIYRRQDVYTLHSREIWVKQARVVKLGEAPYKIVKARPKWDRLNNKMLECQPLEIFGRWQTQKYEPPTAENGIVPRNAYGNVELFQPEMLPKKTVHLRFAGLNRICTKLKVDCAQAVVGFDYHGGSSHPTFDGFVVCEEYAELVTAKWVEEQEEANRKAMDKQKQRIYDNWKKLIKGLLIRERLQRKYNFAGKDTTEN